MPISSLPIMKIKLPSMFFKYGMTNKIMTESFINFVNEIYNLGFVPKICKPCNLFPNTSEIIDSSGRILIADCIIHESTNFSTLYEQSSFAKSYLAICNSHLLTSSHIDQLRVLSETVPVVCHGLKTNPYTFLYPSTKRLFELSDKVEEITSICDRCKRTAIVNANVCFQSNMLKVHKSDTTFNHCIENHKSMCLCWICWTDAISID